MKYQLRDIFIKLSCIDRINFKILEYVVHLKNIISLFDNYTNKPSHLIHDYKPEIE